MCEIYCNNFFSWMLNIYCIKIDTSTAIVSIIQDKYFCKRGHNHVSFYFCNILRHVITAYIINKSILNTIWKYNAHVSVVYFKDIELYSHINSLPKPSLSIFIIRTKYTKYTCISINIYLSISQNPFHHGTVGTELCSLSLRKIFV